MTEIRTFKSRATGTTIEWGRTEDFDLDPSQGKWATVCVDHGEVLMYDTAVAARSYASHSDEWCSECEALR